jgi:V8-like Glu-specific endopeptidase
MIRRFLFCLLLLASAPLADAVSYPGPLPSSYNNVYPFYLIGQVFFKSGNVDYIGSGTVAGPHSVLTAGHNVYDPDTGFSTNFEFYRNTYGPNHSFPVQVPKQRLVFAGYQQAALRDGPDAVTSFAFDAAGLVFTSFVHPAGQRAPSSGDPALLSMRYNKVLVGYGAEGAHNGDYPLYSLPTTPFYQTYGFFYEDFSVYVEGGMSGGPLMVHLPTGWAVMGIVVSGSTRPASGGVRMLDPNLKTFIATYLK